MKLKQVLHPLSQLFSQQKLVSWTKRTTVFPFYHTISNDHLPYISNLYPLRNVDQFSDDLDFLCQHFEPLELGEVRYRMKNNSKIHSPGFHLTFDDGLKEIYDVIAPILEERKIPATFFINTDFIDNKKLFYRYKIGVIIEILKEEDAEEKKNKISSILKESSKWQTDIQDSLLQLIYHDQLLIDEIASVLEVDFNEWLMDHRPYLSSGQIKELIDRGFTIGSHSKDHPRFKYLNLSSQKEQIEKSFLSLKETFNIEDFYFSFPFGDEEVRKELFDWMYSELNCTLSFGVSGIKDDYSPKHLHRIPMDECTVGPDKFIKAEYLYYMVKSIFNRNQITRH